MKETDYREIVEKISTPLLIGQPVYSDEKDYATDFTIVYINDAFRKNLPGAVKIGETLSVHLPNLSKEVPWIYAANEAIKTKKPSEYSVYSMAFSHWMKIIINATDSGIVILSATIIDNDKEHEQQLLRQNLRLAALTDELSLSRENLRGKLDNIKLLNEKLEFNAYHDAMTGLFGRSKFEEDFEEWKKNSEGTDNKFGIMILDIDNMKMINDAQGHSKGDEIIIRSAEILKRLEKENFRSYRFGGDEFIVMINGVESHDTVLNIGDLILELFNEENIKFSAGISLFPTDSEMLEEILKYADMAMYDTKRKGKNSVSFFQTIMRDKFMKRIQLQTHLSKAVENDMFQLYYQPQYDVATGKLRGFEALLRWNDPDLGWVSPENFIPIAEETRLVIPLGDWILETAIKTLKKWQKNFGFDGIMSVNVSPVQLKKHTFIFDLKQLLNKYEIDPATLEIEITEGVFIDNKEAVLDLLRQIREMGLGISLDDFGTGYSSLSYLQILPITTLKIDKSFIANITERNGIEANITDSIISMVTKMGLDTIAEGVENSDQLQILQGFNCKNIQGFLKGRPMPEEKCEEIFNS